MSASDTSVNFRPDARAVAAQMQPALLVLEAARRDALGRRGKARTAAALTAGAGILIAFAIASASRDGPMVAVIVGAGSVLLAILLHHLIHGGACDAYRSRFKKSVFRDAAKIIAPGIDYLPTSMVPQESFKRSALFNSRIDRYQGEDCFRGKAGATDVLFSEVHVQRKDTSTDSKGRRRTTWVTVFKGIYLIADFHKHFRCQVSIEPDFAEANFGWLGRKLQGISGDLIRLENPEFERAFKVRASDPVEARYLLTPDMQERFLALRNRWSSGIRAALLDSSLHLAIPMREDWFEPDINQPAHSTPPLSRFLDQLVLLLHIPEQLDLNTRIWTKE